MCYKFTKCSVEAFYVAFHAKDWELDLVPDCYIYRELMRDADLLYQSLVQLNNWLATTSDADTILTGLVAKIDNSLSPQAEVLAEDVAE